MKREAGRLTGITDRSIHIARSRASIQFWVLDLRSAQPFFDRLHQMAQESEAVFDVAAMVRHYAIDDQNERLGWIALCETTLTLNAMKSAIEVLDDVHDGADAQTIRDSIEFIEP